MKIFLDDYRDPCNCLGYMHTRIGELNPIYNQGWYVIRCYADFVKAVSDHIEEITHVSFDHDLSEGHYHQNMQEGVIDYNSVDFEDDNNKTGYHAALYMKNLYCEAKIKLPIIFVHSMNPVGTQNIIRLFNNPKPN